jgi:hypothetical protein
MDKEIFDVRDASLNTFRPAEIEGMPVVYFAVAERNQYGRRYGQTIYVFCNSADLDDVDYFLPDNRDDLWNITQYVIMDAENLASVIGLLA